MRTTLERMETPVVVTSNGRAQVAEESPGRIKGAVLFGVLRIAMGATFLWAFLDKAFALGFATGRNPETGAIDLPPGSPRSAGSSG